MNRKLVIADWFGYKIPFEERYRLIKSAGFDGITCFWSGDNNIYIGFDDDFRAAPAFAEKAGLTVENVHAPFENINNIWLDNLDGQAVFECLSGCVKDCAEFDIPAVVMHLRRGRTPPAFSNTGLDRVKRLVEIAEKRDVNIAFENLRSNDYLGIILSEIKSPRAGFCFDSGHNNCWTHEENLLADYGSRLFALHLQDNKGETDEHLLPFDGTTDWAKVMKQIAAAGYKGPIALEVENRGNYNLAVKEFLGEAFLRAKKLRELCI